MRTSLLSGTCKLKDAACALVARTGALNGTCVLDRVGGGSPGEANNREKGLFKPRRREPFPRHGLGLWERPPPTGPRTTPFPAIFPRSQEHTHRSANAGAARSLTCSSSFGKSFFSPLVAGAANRDSASAKVFCSVGRCPVANLHAWRTFLQTISFVIKVKNVFPPQVDYA